MNRGELAAAGLLLAVPLGTLAGYLLPSLGRWRRWEKLLVVLAGIALGSLIWIFLRV